MSSPPAPAPESISVVVPNWNGRRWLAGLLRSLDAQVVAPYEIIVVDNGSTDGSLEYLRSQHPAVRVIELARNTGFAYAANRGIEAAQGEFVALVNSDIELDPEWTQHMLRALLDDAAGTGSGGDAGLGDVADVGSVLGDAGLGDVAAVGDVGNVAAVGDVAAVAGKMLSLADPRLIDDAGDVLRRDGACEQRGRFSLDDGRFDTPEEIFGACAGAALYRRSAVVEVGGFDERLFAYLEDVDLAVRLRLAGWRCRYVPAAVSLHAGGGSEAAIGAAGAHLRLVERNTLILVARYFPARWLPMVLYRQTGWLWHARREHRLRAHLAGALGGLALVPAALLERRAIRRGARVPIEEVVPARPFRGSRAGGHRSGQAGSCPR